MATLPQFAERAVYNRTKYGFLQPRRPYLVDNEFLDPHVPVAPQLGEHTGNPTWTTGRLPEVAHVERAPRDGYHSMESGSWTYRLPCGTSVNLCPRVIRCGRDQG